MVLAAMHEMGRSQDFAKTHNDKPPNETSTHQSRNLDGAFPLAPVSGHLDSNSESFEYENEGEVGCFERLVSFRSELHRPN